MKSMKKRLLAGLMAMAMVICTFANVTPASAATLTAKQYLNKMEKAVAKVKSYETTTTTAQDATVSGETMNTTAVAKQIVFADPVKIKYVTTTKIKGAGLDSKSKTTTYVTQTKKGKLMSYTSTDGGKYVKMDMTGMLDELTGINMGGYSDVKIEKKNVKLNKTNTVQIAAQIKGEDLGAIMDAAFSAIGQDDGMTIDFSALKSVNATIWIDKKTYLPVKVTTEMTDFINSYMTALLQAAGAEDGEDLEMSYSKAVSTATYSNFNNATKFTIPKACK